MPLIFFAHATSSDNETRVRSGWADPPLSDRGRQQARNLGRLAAGPFESVYTSDLIRARQTAAIAFPDLGRTAVPDLREMHYGKLTAASDDLFPTDPEACITVRFPGGECCLDVEVRVRRFLDEYVRPDTLVAVVGHKYTQLAFEVILNGHSWQSAIEADWRARGEWRPGWDYPT